MYRILLIDDDVEVLKINQKFFNRNKCDTQICSDSLHAPRITKEFKPQCILLDVMMPGMDGYQLCRQLRKITNAPILFLSGKISEDDKIKGFQCGADDYIEKPYSIKEVYVRMISNIKRHQMAAGIKENTVIEIPPLTIEVEVHKVFYMEEEIPFSNKEYDTLVFLAKRPNEVITFEEIGMAIWGRYTETDRRSVMVNVSRLRKRLSDYTGRDNLIETVWSKGYKLIVG